MMKAKKIITGIIYGIFIIASPIATIIIGFIWITYFILNKKKIFNGHGSILPTIYDDGRIEMNKISYKI